MAEHYKVDADQVRAWLVVGHLMLLLDGLDEEHPAQQVDAPLSGLRAAVANDPVLAELLATPLMLSVAILAYSGDHSDPALEHGSIDTAATASSTST